MNLDNNRILKEFENESNLCKKMAAERPLYWEVKITSELLKTRMEIINHTYNDIVIGNTFQKKKVYSFKDFARWIAELVEEFPRLISVFRNTYEKELIEAYGKPGTQGDILKIKQCTDKIFEVCNEILAWEYELRNASPPPEFSEVKDLLKGWSKALLDEINKLPKLLDEAFSPENIAKGRNVQIRLTFDTPPNFDKIIRIIEKLKGTEKRG